jgi:PAS domain S-box-containing protein
MDELNRLLVVSQGVAASLEVEDAIKPVLESALTIGAGSARIVLGPAALPDLETTSPHPTRFGLGPTSQLYSSLDETILDLARQQERLAFSHIGRGRSLNFPANAPRPEALLAIALRHEQIYYGVLWLAFEKPHPFSDDELRFITTLASQTAVAAANARLFQNAEIGRQRLASILASTSDPVLVTDHHDRLLLANPAAWHALGLNPDTTQGHPLSKVVSQPELANLLRQSTGDRQSVEITAPDQRIYLATASTVIASGRSVGRVCILRDITHFKELDALKSEFVSTVSHDLRSPLTLMRGYATMLEMVGQMNDQQVNYVNKIILGVDTMARLVSNLLDLGRIEAGVDLQLELGEIPTLVERVSNTLQPTANQKQIALSYNLPAQGLPIVEADQGLLQQALHNLVENAIKYTDPGGKVTLDAVQQGDNIRFTVKDTGIGIAPVDQPRLFEKFYRGAQRETRKRQGSGLGLAIVKSVIERHNGKIWVDSQLGKGSTFSFIIPLRQPRRQNKGEKSLLTE